MLGWLVQSARDRGPYPILAVYGQHGSAKSTASRLMRSIIDPNQAPLRSPPREIRDLAIAANNGWVLTLDNLSTLPVWLSDGLCVLSTGGGFATRTLYTDEEESIFSFRRPAIINGIAEVAERGDLIDRCIPITLDVIDDEHRRTEAEIEAMFEGMHPRILGGLLNALVTALSKIEETVLPRKSRMADLVTWVVAAEASLALPQGDFLRAYDRARGEAIETSIDSSTVGQWVREIALKSGFAGTATELYDRAEEKLRRASDWPKNARAPSQELKRLAPSLRTWASMFTGRRRKRRPHGA